MAARRRPFVAYQNPEKAGHGSAAADPFVPQAPFRWLFVGPPSCGKRNSLMNVLAAVAEDEASRPTTIIVVHADPETVEYAGIANEIRGPEDPPSLEEMVGEAVGGRDAHKVIVIDEIPWGGLSKAVLSRYERLLNFVSTHSTTSVLMCFQQLKSVPTSIRRAFNLVTLFKHVDIPASAGLAERVGMDRSALKEILNDILRDKHDSLTIDLSAGPEEPQRLRLSLWTPITPRED